MSLRVPNALYVAVWAVVGLLFWLVVTTPARAQTAYTSDDVLSAIDEASAEIGVDHAWLTRIVRCEDPGLDPYAVGRQGELGAAQLHPRGELLRFTAWGYTDPFSPYQSVRFLAQRLSMGGARAWSCR